MLRSSELQGDREHGLESLQNASPSREKLKIFADVEPSYAELDSPDSLFDEMIPPASSSPVPAMLHAPPVPGLFFTPSLLIPVQLADEVTHFCLDNYFNRPGVNQIMLFGVASSSAAAPLSGLPPVLITLLSTVSSLLEPTLPPEIHTLLFPPNPTRARQAILNLYHPGEGIIPHVDLLRRFGDGIVGVSFGSSCVMEFARVDKAAAAAPLQLFLPERSVIVLSRDARYAWTHGIEKRTADVVADGDAHRVVQRGVRLSITFRWLLPGADVVGQDD
ncbi:hypothetical protein C8R45DRAFT_1009212 [Mycena sanguinolenta]|nr:hypothetical protein C8R45DRAFT_1009212 [Mycena sanguinolenta]